MERLLVAPLVLGLLGAALTLVLPRGRLWAGLVLCLAAVVGNGLLLRDVMVHGPLALTMGNWPPPFGITFAVDIASAGFSLTAALVTCSVFLVLARDRAASHPATAPLILLLFAGVSGALHTGDLFNLYVWFELILIASIGLLSLGGLVRDLEATLKYGLLNLLGTSIFLVALGLCYGSFGTLNMADLARAVPLASPGQQLGVAALVLAGFLIKAGAFPVQVWLPAAYHVPHPAISALFGALLTKVGVYSLFRVFTLSFLVPGRDLSIIIGLAAIGTLIFAPLAAFAETDVRRAIGFLVVGGIGSALAGLALGPEGYAGGLAYAVQAMPVLAAAYLVMGRLEAGSVRPALRLMALVLLLSLAGVPPLSGFWPKVMLFQAAFAPAGGNPWIGLALLLNAFLTLVAISRLHARQIARLPDGAASGTGLPLLFAAIALVPGLLPGPLLDWATRAAGGLVDPAAYVAAVGLGSTLP